MSPSVTRRWLALLALAALSLSALAIFDPFATAPMPTTTRLFTREALASAQEIEVSTAARRYLLSRAADGRWRLVEPQAAVDEDATRRLLGVLEMMRVLRRGRSQVAEAGEQVFLRVDDKSFASGGSTPQGNQQWLLRAGKGGEGFLVESHWIDELRDSAESLVSARLFAGASGSESLGFARGARRVHIDREKLRLDEDDRSYLWKTRVGPFAQWHARLRDLELGPGPIEPSGCGDAWRLTVDQREALVAECGVCEGGVHVFARVDQTPSVAGSLCLADSEWQALVSAVDHPERFAELLPLPSEAIDWHLGCGDLQIHVDEAGHLKGESEAMSRERVLEWQSALNAQVEAVELQAAPPSAAPVCRIESTDPSWRARELFREGDAWRVREAETGAQLRLGKGADSLLPPTTLRFRTRQLCRDEAIYAVELRLGSSRVFHRDIGTTWSGGEGAADVDALVVDLSHLGALRFVEARPPADALRWTLKFAESPHHPAHSYGGLFWRRGGECLLAFEDEPVASVEPKLCERVSQLEKASERAR